MRIKNNDYIYFLMCISLIGELDKRNFRTVVGEKLDYRRYKRNCMSDLVSNISQQSCDIFNIIQHTKFYRHIGL